MDNPSKSYLTLTAGDVMSREVITVPREMPLSEAANILSKAQISGVPVVDDGGKCLGVLSAADFLRSPKNEGMPVEADGGNGASPATVAKLMTADPVTVSPSTPIRKIARQMLDAHIHRVVVVDEHDRPIGIVSTTDILAALAYGLT
jgi:CBS domain-containing protein